MSEANAVKQKQSEADELKSLADKFLASQGVATKSEDVKKANVKGSDLNILIAVPAYSGELKYKTVLSLISLVRKLRDLGIRHQIEVMPHCPIIQIVRDYFANKCAFDLDQDGLSYSHLLFIDSDSGNYENGVLKLIMEDKPIAGLLYSTKDLAWRRIASVVRSGADMNQLREYGGIPDLNMDKPFAVNSLSPVRHIGCGTLLIQKKVLLDLAAAHPEWRYHVYGASYFFGEPNPSREWNFSFFQMWHTRGKLSRRRLLLPRRRKIRLENSTAYYSLGSNSACRRSNI